MRLTNLLALERDADGDINITDFNFLAANFADTGYDGNAIGDQVPEPTTFACWPSVDYFCFSAGDPDVLNH